MSYSSRKGEEGKSHNKGWGILRKDKITGKLEGYYDQSMFRVGWSSWIVLVFSHPIEQRTITDLNRHDKGHEYFTVRVNSKNCPIMIDWTARSNDRSTQKGNRPFKINPNQKI